MMSLAMVAENQPMRVAVRGRRDRSLVWATLDYTRFNLGVLGLGVFFLIGVGQGADVVRSLAANDALRNALFYLGVFAWGWQSWFWARFMLRDRLGEQERKVDAGSAERDARFVRWYPRLLGLAAMTAATLALALNHGIASPYVWINVATTAVYVALVVKRRAIRRWLSTRSAAAEDPATGHGDMAVLGPATIAGGLLLSAATGAWALADPVGYGFSVGSAAVLFIALAAILPVGSIVVWWTRHRGRPVLTVLVVLALAFSLFNNNHDVRALDRPAAAKPAAWDSLDALLQRHGDGTAPLPVVMVATAGGGIRAAYWTATVLAAAEDELRAREPTARFAEHLFAVSGVSGGSVGAAFYTAALRDLGAAAPKGAALRETLSSDFLGPAIVGLMYQDLAQTFLPVPVLEGRGAILERAFESAWAAHTPAGAPDATPDTTRGLRAGLAALTTLPTAAQPWLPRLLLNGTNNVTGQRMLAATMSLRDPIGDGRHAEVIVDALDQHDYLSGDADAPAPDMRLSTAAHNSARFPVISPAGVWPRGRSMVVDGGYFENYGAETLLDLVTYLRERNRLQRLHRSIRPVIVQISSDPAIGDTLSDGPAAPPIAGGIGGSAWISRLWNLVYGPLGGILSTRTSRGILAATDLRLWVESVGLGERDLAEPLWLHFKMPTPGEVEHTPGCDRDEAVTPPLGWVLSAQSRHAIDDMIPCVAHNREAMKRLVDALAPFKRGAAPAPAAAGS